MARSTAEIQADIALIRRLIEAQLDALQQRVPRRWWTPYALFGGAVVVGVLLARLPLFRLVDQGARAVRAGFSVASAVGAADRFIAERRRRAA